MSLALPGPVAAYFDAEKAADADALARCFVEEGVVRDEGGTFKGPAAIGMPFSRERRISNSRNHRLASGRRDPR